MSSASKPKVIERYADWVEKTKKRMLCSRQPDRIALLNRFQSLALREDLLGVKAHIDTLSRVVVEFKDERKGLRWVEKFEKDLVGWKQIVEASIFAVGVDTDTVIDAMLEEDVDVETAVGLL